MVTQLVLLLWLDNTEQLQESSHEDEGKENKAVFKSVTSVIILEGGWEGEGRQHSVRAVTTQVWVQLYCKGALLIGKLISLFQGKLISLGNSCKQHQQLFCVEMYTRAYTCTQVTVVWQTPAHQLHVAWGGTSEFTTHAGSLQIDKQGTIIIF